MSTPEERIAYEQYERNTGWEDRAQAIMDILRPYSSEYQQMFDRAPTFQVSVDCPGNPLNGRTLTTTSPDIRTVTSITQSMSREINAIVPGVTQEQVTDILKKYSTNTQLTERGGACRYLQTQDIVLRLMADDILSLNPMLKSKQMPTADDPPNNNMPTWFWWVIAILIVLLLILYFRK